MPTNLKQMQTDGCFRGLFVGPTGRGKTVAAGSFPGPILVLDFENRHEPLKDWYADRDDIEVEVITPYNYFSVFVPLINGPAIKKYKTIIVDSITSISNVTITMQLKIREGSDSKEFQPKTNKSGISVASWDEFNGEATIITGLFEVLKSLKCNLIATAHPVQKSTDGKSWTSLVSYGNKLNTMVPGYFNEVFFFDYEFGLSDSGGVKRVVRTSPSSNYPDAKTSIKGLPPTIDITNKNLYDIIKPYLEA